MFITTSTICVAPRWPAPQSFSPGNALGLWWMQQSSPLSGDYHHLAYNPTCTMNPQWMKFEPMTTSTRNGWCFDPYFYFTDTVTYGWGMQSPLAISHIVERNNITSRPPLDGSGRWWNANSATYAQWGASSPIPNITTIVILCFLIKIFYKMW